MSIKHLFVPFYINDTLKPLHTGFKGEFVLLFFYVLKHFRMISAYKFVQIHFYHRPN